MRKLHAGVRLCLCPGIPTLVTEPQGATLHCGTSPIRSKMGVRDARFFFQYKFGSREKLYA